MIIGVLGKGGSGKSTISTALVRYLGMHKKETVLAIDADHNMDLSYNLGAIQAFPYLGSAMQDLKQITGLDAQESYRTAVLQAEKELFSLTPKDSFTEKYAYTISDTVSLMAAGPQTEEVLSDVACSHILFTPLKVYLPLLSLAEGQWCIVDEKAGADGVSTGIPTGFDSALIVVEPTVHSIKTAKQIAVLLDYFDVPYAFVCNKVAPHHSMEEICRDLEKTPLLCIPFAQESTTDASVYMEQIIESLSAQKAQIIGKRLIRSKQKFEKNTRA